MEEPPLASVWRRVQAYALDVFVLFIGILVVQFLLRPVNPLLGGPRPSGSAVHGWVLATVSVPLILYFAIAWTRASGATVGMRLRGIRVSREDGGRLSFGRALLRAVVMLVPFELNHVVLLYPRPIWSDASPGFRWGFIGVDALMLGYVLTAVYTHNRQGPHDLIARSVVRMSVSDWRVS